MTVLVVFASAAALSARPQVVSLILLAVTVHAWLRTWDDGRIRWWLIALTWVWATAHGLWSAGVLVGFVACVGLVLDRRATGRRARTHVRRPRRVAARHRSHARGAALLLAQFAVSERTSLIPEWGPTSFRSVPALVAALMVAALVVLWARRGSVPWTHLLLALLAAGWILLVTRMVPMGAVVLAPLLVAAISESSRRSGTPDRTGSRRLSWASVAVALPRGAGARRPAHGRRGERRPHRGRASAVRAARGERRSWSRTASAPGSSGRSPRCTR